MWQVDAGCDLLPVLRQVFALLRSLRRQDFPLCPVLSRMWGDDPEGAEGRDTGRAHLLGMVATTHNAGMGRRFNRLGSGQNQRSLQSHVSALVRNIPGCNHLHHFAGAEVHPEYRGPFQYQLISAVTASQTSAPLRSHRFVDCNPLH
jgi:hypothetical protein